MNSKVIESSSSLWRNEARGIVELSESILFSFPVGQDASGEKSWVYLFGFEIFQHWYLCHEGREISSLWISGRVAVRFTLSKKEGEGIETRN